MGKENGGFLLSHDDILTVSVGIYIQIHLVHRAREDCFSPLQQMEIQVSFELA